MPSTHIDTTWLDVTLIDIPSDSRQHDPEKLATLTKDMREQGQLQEIVVAQVGDRYEVLAGAGRMQVARSLGWDKIRASVRQGVSEFDKARITFAENEDREDADAFYQAAQLGKMLKARGCSQQALAKELGISDGLMSGYRTIDGLPDNFKKTFNRLKLAHLIQIARLQDNKKQIDLAKQTVNHDLSVRQVKALVDKLLGKKKPASSAGAARQGDVAKAEVEWRGEEIVINRHFRPVEESLAEYLERLSQAIKPMLMMPGLKDSPKTEKALSAAMEATAAKANAEAQVKADEALSKMSPAQLEHLKKQFKKSQEPDSAAQAELEAMQKKIEADNDPDNAAAYFAKHLK